MRVFDDKCKKTTWYNRNYFYLGTIIVVVINILLFYFLGDSWEESFKVSEGGNSAFDYANLIRLFMNAYSHSDWEHVLLNMLCTAVCGLYIERKIGSINMLLLVLVLTPMANWTAGANRLGVNSHGFSCVLYALYAFVLIDYIFSFQKHKRNLFNMILGAVVLVYIYIAMSWDSSKSFPFVWYPIDFIYHKGHYSGFIIGVIFSLCLQFTDIYVRKRTLRELNNGDNTVQYKSGEIRPTNSLNQINNKIDYYNQTNVNNNFPAQNNRVATNNTSVINTNTTTQTTISKPSNIGSDSSVKNKTEQIHNNTNNTNIIANTINNNSNIDNINK